MEDHEVVDQFARGIWRSMIPAEDPEWVLRVADLEPTDQPCGDYGDLIRRMLAAGVSAEDIARLARIVGYEVAHGISYYLGDPQVAATEAEPMDDVAWELFGIDTTTDEPLRPLFGVHEVLLGLDPTGREMRPPVP